MIKCALKWGDLFKECVPYTERSMGGLGVLKEVQ